MRTHIVLPDDLVAGVDELVGKRKRSEFIAEAARQKLRQVQQLRAIREGAGAIDLNEHPEWSTREKTIEWVRAQRAIPSSYDKRIAREKARGDVSARHKRAG
jgi:metal-responsive CopG/Arc/MetJ family transcriptional regulator